MICWPYSQDIQRQFDGTVAQCRLMLLLSLVVLLRVAAIAVVAAGVVVAAVVLLIVMVGMLQQLLVLVWLGMLLLPSLKVTTHWARGPQGVEALHSTAPFAAHGATSEQDRPTSCHSTYPPFLYFRPGYPASPLPPFLFLPVVDTL